MSALNLSVDELLTTTRAVRKRLDVNRPVESAVIRECLELAMQAPSPGNLQNRHFVVVTDPAQRTALAVLYQKGAWATGQEEALQQAIASAGDENAAATARRMADSARQLTDRLHEVPVHVFPASSRERTADRPWSRRRSAGARSCPRRGASCWRRGRAASAPS